MTHCYQACAQPETLAPFTSVTSSCLMLTMNIQLYAGCSCMFCSNQPLDEIMATTWWWYVPRCRIKSARLSGGPGGAEIWGWACLWEYICVPPRPWLAVQWDCILALTTCSFLYANSSFVCWQAHWQHVGWGKAPVRIIHCTSAAPPHNRWRMLENVACVHQTSYFENYVCTHSFGTSH